MENPLTFFFKPSLSLTPSLNYFRARFTNNKSETHYRSASKTSSNYLIIYSWFSINLQFISHTGMILTNVHDLSLYYLSVLKCSVHDCILHYCSVCDWTECGCIILDRTHLPWIFKTGLNTGHVYKNLTALYINTQCTWLQCNSL